jgi:perosamine synthetase
MGEKVMVFRIPVCAPKIGEKEVEYVSKCVRSSWISYQSEYVSEFEEKFARFCDCKYGVATNSGTTALHLAMATLGICKGDEVISPTFTMIATANSVTYTGAKPVLVDSEMETWNIDVTKIEEKITKRTKAIMPIHTYGHPCDMDPVMELAEKYDLYVVEDAAEAHGAEYKCRKTGSLGNMGCFSFYANKIITTGEGGMIVTNDEKLAERARWLRAHAFGMHNKHFYHEAIGFGYRITGMQAALGLAQLENIVYFIETRRNNAKFYNSLLVELDDRISLPPEAEWSKSVYWMYSILTKSRNVRTRLMRFLEEKRIETRTFFYPIHQQPIYQHLAKGSSFPKADDLSKRGMNLPSGNNLTRDDVQYICNSIIDFYK